jgi:hypothetical protein
MVAALLSRFAWLWFCAWIGTKHPKQAAAIISASGRHFPFERAQRRWRFG